MVGGPDMDITLNLHIEQLATSRNVLQKKNALTLPRNFEPLSSDENNTRGGSITSLYNTTFVALRNLDASSPLYCRSLLCTMRTNTATHQLLDPWLLHGDEPIFSSITIAQL